MAKRAKPIDEDAKRKPAGALVVFIFALLLGAVAALVVWVFVYAMGLSYEYLWQILPAAVAVPFLPVLICGAGGLLIGLWEKYVWPPPLLLEDSLEIISKDKRFPYAGLYKTVVSSFLPLAFGGSVGPEAGLVNIVAGLCTWVGDKLKAAGVASSELAEAGLAATMSAVFGAPIAGLVAPLEGRLEAEGSSVISTSVVMTPASKRSKLALYLAAVVGGMVAMFALTHFFGGGLGLPRFERTEWQPGDILLSVPLALIGVLGAYLFYAADMFTARLAGVLKSVVILRTVLCGIILGLVGSFLPYTMFSGEEQMVELMHNYGTLGAWLLIATGVLKICISPLCVNMGWRGGNIFPLIFAGVSIGYGTSLLTGIDPILCVAVIATSMSAAVMRKPVLAIAVLLLCFPVADIIFIAVAALIGGAAPLPNALKKKEMQG